MKYLQLNTFYLAAEDTFLSAHLIKVMALDIDQGKW